MGAAPATDPRYDRAVGVHDVEEGEDVDDGNAELVHDLLRSSVLINLDGLRRHLGEGLIHDEAVLGASGVLRDEEVAWVAAEASPIFVMIIPYAWRQGTQWANGARVLKTSFPMLM